ncbi:MAG: SRPBCC domain-containing protein [Euryarchaeota archaeon]|nr:SRPBCC domain-containing protein [Euryarchaeota archaeon]
MSAIRQEFALDVPPREVRAALTNIGEIQKWWTRETKGSTGVGEQFAVKFSGDDAFALFEVVRSDDDRVVWKCVDSKMMGGDEWTGTTVEWHIKDKDGRTLLELVHDGFAQGSTVMRVCTEGWAYYAGESLGAHLVRGEGIPYDPEQQEFQKTL